jgi:catechol 2,3-dioxygenase-like lactoylglutathione lyase family enzyme
VQGLDHVSITVRDLARALSFYDAIFSALEMKKAYERPDAVGYGERNRPNNDGHSYLSVYQSAAANTDRPMAIQLKPPLKRKRPKRGHALVFGRRCVRDVHDH